MAERQDPIDTYRRADAKYQRALQRERQKTDTLMRERDQAALAASASGLSVRQFAKAVGVSPARVQQMIERARKGQTE